MGGELAPHSKVCIFATATKRIGLAVRLQYTNSLLRNGEAYLNRESQLKTCLYHFSLADLCCISSIYTGITSIRNVDVVDFEIMDGLGHASPSEGVKDIYESIDSPLHTKVRREKCSRAHA